MVINSFIILKIASNIATCSTLPAILLAILPGTLPGNIARCGCLYSRNFQTSVARNLLSVDGFAIHLPAILPVPPILLAILLDVDACLGEPPSTQ